MCGIFAVLQRPAVRRPPEPNALVRDTERCVKILEADRSSASLLDAASVLADVNEQLKGAAGAVALVRNSDLRTKIASDVQSINRMLEQVEAGLDDEGRAGKDLESLNAACVALRGAAWSIDKDRLVAADSIVKMLGSELDRASDTTIGSYLGVQFALSNIDRLEVRGRDSAGIAVCVSRESLSVDPGKFAARHKDLLIDGSVIVTDKSVAFLYKAAAEIGALGDNVASIRASIETDELLRDALISSPTLATVVAHTRWASVGTVSEPNAHPVDSAERSDSISPISDRPATQQQSSQQQSSQQQPTQQQSTQQPSQQSSQKNVVLASLNGDVDNYASLKSEDNLAIAEEITTDAKVIPVLTKRGLVDGKPLVEAFRGAVSRFVGSVAIVANEVDDPSQLVLAVKGSGQGCYVGLAEDAFVVASEPYGLVEVCDRYVRLDGEGAASDGTTGQIVELNRENAGQLAGIKRLSYSGIDLPVTEADLVVPEVTTKDIDRAGAPHFLLKEILESPNSVAKTVRGKIVSESGRLTVALPETTLPTSISGALGDGTISQVYVIGQGTAAVAGQSLAAVLNHVGPSALSVTATPATELSGFLMRDDMSDCLIIAVSQSGTTTDTNRTVDMARGRGARVIAIVNRRNSDLAVKADGVLYTSDGRDIEMSVASTKAFYSQVAASVLLGVAIAKACGDYNKIEAEELLRALRELPAAMRTVLSNRNQIAKVASTYAPAKKSWALVGNGANVIAARELRIKLSELCYKSIACDITEDKKHIDLSAEPLILVCAAGLTGSNAADVDKEVAIYGAHKATPIVIASEGAKCPGAAAVIEVPSVQPFIDFVLSTVVGHLFGYEAALAIDAQGKLVRSTRAVFDDALALCDAEGYDGDQVLSTVASAIFDTARALLAELGSGRMNGHLEPSTASELAVLLRVAMGVIPLDVIEFDFGRTVSPFDMVDELAKVLNKASDELTRPIDAVKHQAKTVTVGISRTEDSFADNVLINAVVEAGVDRERLSYKSLRTLAGIAPVVEAVKGWTRYEVGGDLYRDMATAKVVAKHGIATDIASRIESDARLTGVKHRAASERLVTIGRGERDGRTFVLVPELNGRDVEGLVLLHVQFENTADAITAASVLKSYRDRYSALVDAVTETHESFDDNVLDSIPLIDLMIEPVRELARHWRTN